MNKSFTRWVTYALLALVAASMVIVDLLPAIE